MTARPATHSQHLWLTPYGAAPPGDAQILAVPADPKAASDVASRPGAPPRSNQSALTPAPTLPSTTLHVPITSPRLGYTRPPLPAGSGPHRPNPLFLLPLPTPPTRVAANPGPPPLSAPSTHPRFLQASRDSPPGGTPCY